MKDLKIGDKVKIYGKITDFYYNDRNLRQYHTVRFHEPQEAIITGKKRRFYGKYIGGRELGGTWNDPPEWAPPFLDVKGSWVFWLVRKTLLSKEIEVPDYLVEGV